MAKVKLVFSSNSRQTPTYQVVDIKRAKRQVNVAAHVRLQRRLLQSRVEHGSGHISI
jgi:dsRNA-specific ribonuclease